MGKPPKEPVDFTSYWLHRAMDTGELMNSSGVSHAGFTLPKCSEAIEHLLWLTITTYLHAIGLELFKPRLSRRYLIRPWRTHLRWSSMVYWEKWSQELIDDWLLGRL